MSDALSVEERQAAMVTEELNSGRWIQVQDERGRKVFYCPGSKETTRDLRMWLLRREGWEMLAAKTDQQKAGQHKQQRDVEIATAEEQLRQELADSRALIEAYESEVTWLRMSLLEVEGRLDRGELAVAETSRLSRFSNRAVPSSSSSSTAKRPAAAPSGASSTGTPPPPGSSTHDASPAEAAPTRRSASPRAARGSLDEDDTSVLILKLSEARRLNQRLLNRVSLDRQTKHLCSRCLQDVERTASHAGADDAMSALQRARGPVTGEAKAPYSLTVPGGVGFPSTLSNPMTFDSIMLSRGLAAASVSHPAATVSQLGYLPKQFDPMKSSMDAVGTHGRAWESPAKRALSPNSRKRAAITSSSSTHNSPRRGDPHDAIMDSSNNNNTGDVSTTALQKNLHSLQALRTTLEGNFRTDSHIRDAERNDFFRSPYFTASLKNRTAGSGSTNLIDSSRLNSSTGGGGYGRGEAFIDANGQIVVPPQQQQQQAPSSMQQSASQESAGKKKLSGVMPGRLYSGHLYGTSYLM